METKKQLYVELKRIEEQYQQTCKKLELIKTKTKNKEQLLPYIASSSINAMFLNIKNYLKKENRQPVLNDTGLKKYLEMYKKTEKTLYFYTMKNNYSIDENTLTITATDSTKIKIPLQLKLNSMNSIPPRKPKKTNPVGNFDPKLVKLIKKHKKDLKKENEKQQ